LNTNKSIEKFPVEPIILSIAMKKEWDFEKGRDQVSFNALTCLYT